MNNRKSVFSKFKDIENFKLTRININGRFNPDTKKTQKILIKATNEMLKNSQSK